MPIKIITDTTSDVPYEKQKELDIEILPLKVLFGEEEYIPNVNLTTAEFYEKLAQFEGLPKTQQISPAQFQEIFKKHLDAGDEVIGLFISSSLSGTYFSANIAREEIGSDKIHLVDTKQVTMGLGCAVYRAIDLRREGLGGKEIADRLEKELPRIKLYAAVDCLTYLQKGGCLSNATAFVGGLLNIKPIISVEDDGWVKNIGKARGMQKGYEQIKKILQTHEVDYTKPCVFGHTNAPQAGRELEEYLKAEIPELKNAPCYFQDIGSVVGTHVGPGAAGIAVFYKE